MVTAHSKEGDSCNQLMFTLVVPAASGGGANPPHAFELAKAPLANRVAAQPIRCQVTDVEARKLPQEIRVRHPAAEGEKKKERLSAGLMSNISIFQMFTEQKISALFDVLKKLSVYFMMLLNSPELSIIGRVIQLLPLPRLHSIPLPRTDKQSNKQTGQTAPNASSRSRNP